MTFSLDFEAAFVLDFETDYEPHVSHNSFLLFLAGRHRALILSDLYASYLLLGEYAARSSRIKTVLYK
jgi:hypothetical protein